VIREYPEPGSVQETLLQLVIAKQEYNEMERVRLLLQANVDNTQVKKHWDAFIEKAYPWAKQAAEDESTRVARFLEAEVKRGPLVVRPSVPLMRSMLPSDRPKPKRK